MQFLTPSLCSSSQSYCSSFHHLASSFYHSLHHFSLILNLIPFNCSSFHTLFIIPSCYSSFLLFAPRLLLMLLLQPVSPNIFLLLLFHLFLLIASNCISFHPIACHSILLLFSPIYCSPFHPIALRSILLLLNPSYCSLDILCSASHHFAPCPSFFVTSNRTSVHPSLLIQKPVPTFCYSSHFSI
jgi:hypothetical protein